MFSVYYPGTGLCLYSLDLTSSITVQSAVTVVHIRDIDRRKSNIVENGEMK